MIRTTRRLNERGPARKLRSEINKLWDAIEGQRIASTPSVRAKRTRNGVALEVIKAGGTITEKADIQAFYIVDVQNEYLNCWKIRDNLNIDNSTTYSVAKPQHLKAPDKWGDTPGVASEGYDDPDGITGRQRWTYSFNTSYQITERIKPYYETGDRILAVRKIVLEDTDGDGNRIEWTDLNIDGRNWFIEPQATTLCDKSSGTPVEKTGYVARSYVQGEND